MDSSLLSNQHTGRWIVLEKGVYNRSIILQEIFHLSQNFYHATEKKQTMGIYLCHN